MRNIHYVKFAFFYVLGGYYLGGKKYSMAKKYFSKSVKQADEKKSPWLTYDLYIKLAGVCVNLEQNAEAAIYLERSLAIHGRLKFKKDDSKYKLNLILNLATLYKDTQNETKRYEWLTQALQLVRTNADATGWLDSASLYVQLFDWSLKNKDYDSTNRYYHEMKRIFSRLPAPSGSNQSDHNHYIRLQRYIEEIDAQVQASPNLIN